LSVAWLTGWKYRKKLTINDAAVVGGAHVDFPVAVIIDQGVAAQAAADLGAGCTDQVNAGDIRITKNDAETVINYERGPLVFSGGNLAALLWVRHESLPAAGDFWYVYYGNSGAPDGGAISPTDPWSSRYAAVWHLDKDLLDSTGNGHTLINANTTQAGGWQLQMTLDAAQKSRGFNGTNARLTCADHDDFDNANDANFTLSFWATVDAAAARYARIFDNRGGQGVYVYLDGTGPDYFQGYYDGAGTLYSGASNPTVDISDDSWYLWHFVVEEGTGFKVYKDDALDRTTANAADAGAMAPDKAVWIGDDGVGARYFTGSIGEMRYASGADTLARIQTTYNNCNDPATFFTWGSEEAASGATVILLNQSQPL